MTVVNALRRIERVLQQPGLSPMVRILVRMAKRDLEQYLTQPPRTTAEDIARLQEVVDGLKRMESDQRARTLAVKQKRTRGPR